MEPATVFGLADSNDCEPVERPAIDAKQQAVAAANAGRFNDARGLFFRYIQTNGADWESLDMLSQVELNLSLMFDSAGHALGALARMPRADTILSLARSHLGMGEVLIGIRLLKQIINRDPSTDADKSDLVGEAKADMLDAEAARRRWRTEIRDRVRRAVLSKKRGESEKEYRPLSVEDVANTPSIHFHPLTVVPAEQEQSDYSEHRGAGGMPTASSTSKASGAALGLGHDSSCCSKRECSCSSSHSPTAPQSAARPGQKRARPGAGAQGLRSAASDAGGSPKRLRTDPKSDLVTVESTGAGVVSCGLKPAQPPADGSVEQAAQQGGQARGGASSSGADDLDHSKASDLTIVSGGSGAYRETAAVGGAAAAGADGPGLEEAIDWTIDAVEEEALARGMHSLAYLASSVCKKYGGSLEQCLEAIGASKPRAGT